MKTIRVVVDTSVVFAAAIRDGRVRRLLLSPGIEWIAPRATGNEMRRHAARVAKELQLPRSEGAEFVENLISRLVEVPVAAGDPEYAAAENLIGDRDPTDVPFVAAALKTRAIGIWSLDHDFDGLEGIARLTTAQIEREQRRRAMPAEEE